MSWSSQSNTHHRGASVTPQVLCLPLTTGPSEGSVRHVEWQDTRPGLPITAMRQTFPLPSLSLPPFVPWNEENKWRKTTLYIRITFPGPFLIILILPTFLNPFFLYPFCLVPHTHTTSSKSQNLHLIEFISTVGSSTVFQVLVVLYLKISTKELLTIEEPESPKSRALGKKMEAACCEQEIPW